MKVLLLLRVDICDIIMIIITQSKSLLIFSCLRSKHRCNLQNDDGKKTLCAHVFIDGDPEARVLTHIHLHTEVLLPEAQLEQQDPGRHGLVEVASGALRVRGS